MKIYSEVMMRSPRCLWDTYPAGAAPLSLGKEQGGTLQHCPRGRPVFPVWQNKEKKKNHKTKLCIAI